MAVASVALDGGVATYDYQIAKPAGSYTVKADFVSTNPNFTGSSDSTTLAVTQEDATVTYTGDTGLLLTAGPSITSATVRLAAHLDQPLDGHAGDITKATVDFLIYQGSSASGTPTVIISGVPVSAAGDAATTKVLTCDEWYIVARVTPSNTYWTSSATDGTLVTIDPGTGTQTVTGGGWVQDSSSINGKANFGFTVNYQKSGSPKGNSIFLFRSADGYNYLVKSNSWAGGGLTFSGTNKAAFSGKCVIQKISRLTGLVVDSSGNGSFTVDILDGDLASPKVTDRYGITILDSSGVIWHRIGTINNPVAMGGGNVIVHSK